ncbi:uncharacterized protein LOC124957527 [Vespa velutina]|uniref:uncharacterized protein LOC124957527 n=1 Tax=Vespa velutina TaxID=202808 RepID=UPI001FB48086|nr:uncharacterized protein LOC124957527 [Vespa velutina]
MHSHTSIVHNGRREYLFTLTHQLCQQLHSTGTLSLSLGPNVFISGIKKNSTNIRSITLRGTTSTDGTCKGSQYSDFYGTWDDVVVQASVKITLRDFYANVKMKANQVHLQIGTVCALDEETCLDSDGSETYWSNIPTDSCGFNEYDVLYDRLATKLIPAESLQGSTLYTVTIKDVTFALTRTSEFILCVYSIVKTEHPKLFILETSPGRTFKGKMKSSVENLDIFAYVNSKFIYVERNLKTQLNALYIDVTRQKCVLEQQVLKNTLSLATLAPDEMAYALMKQSG